jgi:copper(I)-binding protein
VLKGFAAASARGSDYAGSRGEKVMNLLPYRRLAGLCLAGVLLVAPLLAGCTNEPARLGIENAHVEFSEAMRDEASVHLMIRNDGGKDTLIAAKTSIPGALAYIHEMRGVMMVMSKSLTVPAKGSLDMTGTVSHIMIVGVPAEVNQGYHFTLTLTFKNAGEIQVPLVFAKPRSLPSAQPEPRR